MKLIQPGHTFVWSGAGMLIKLQPLFILPVLSDIVQDAWRTGFHIAAGDLEE